MISQTKPAAYLEALKTATPINIETKVVAIEPVPVPSSKSNISWLLIGLGLIGGCVILYNQIHQQQKPE